MILINNKLYRKILYSFFYCLSLISIAFIYGCSVTKKLNIDGHEGHIRTGSLQPDSGEETDLSPSVRECINELIINDNLEKYFNNDFFDENKGFVNDLIGSCTKADDGNSFLPTPVWVYRPAITWIYALSVCVNSVSTQALFSSRRGSNDLPNYYTKDSDKRLKQKRNPYQHTENKHIPEKGSKCEICNKVFRSTYEFKRHQVVHSNKRRHKCPYCNKDYKRKDHLKKHIDKKHPNALS